MSITILYKVYSLYRGIWFFVTFCYRKLHNRKVYKLNNLIICTMDKKLYNRNRIRIWRYNKFPEKYPHLKDVKIDTPDNCVPRRSSHRRTREQILLDIKLKEEARERKDKERIAKIEEKIQKRVEKETIRFQKFEKEMERESIKRKMCCSICGNRNLVQDHNHICCIKGNGCDICRREFICYNCNMILGLCKEDVDILQRIINYKIQWDKIYKKRKQGLSEKEIFMPD